MSDNTGIEWTDATWNPVAGCSILSPACAHCYAMKMAARLAAIGQAKYQGLTQPSKAGPVWTGKVALDDAALTQPLRWKRARRIFVNSMSDLFHEGVPDAFIDKVFAVMALTPQHTYQLLTKRADRMRDYLRSQPTLRRLDDAICALRKDDRHVGPLPHLEPGERWYPLANVWLGVSVEDQKHADARIPLLLDTPAAVRWISAEPLLGPIDLTGLNIGTVVSDDPELDGGQWAMNCLIKTPPGSRLTGLDWVVVGGESGPDARPMHPDWARSLRDQCAAAEVPFFFKQWGEWLDEMVATVSGHAPGPAMFDAQSMPRGDRWHFYDPNDRLGGAMIRIGKKAAGHLLDGVEHREYPR